MDGKGRPMFASLEMSKGKHMADGYEDMSPREGPFGSMFKRYLNAKHGNAIGGGR